MFIVNFAHGVPLKLCLFLQCETDDMYAKIADLEDNIKDANKDSDNFDADIRDTGKKVQKLETGLEEVLEKMMQSAAKMDEAEKEFKDKDDDVNAQSRRVLLLEEECRIRNVFTCHNSVKTLHFITLNYLIKVTSQLSKLFTGIERNTLCYDEKTILFLMFLIAVFLGNF